MPLRSLLVSRALLALPAAGLLVVGGIWSARAEELSSNAARPECPNRCCVFEERDPTADWDCRTPESCVADYLSFVDLAKEHARPISESELERQLDEVRQGRVGLLDNRLPEAELSALILEICNVGFLRQGIDQRPLHVTITAEEQSDDYTLRELLFEDPYVGKFKGLLLLPRGAGPFPGVVALHGHDEQAQSFMRNYGGEQYPRRGYAILMLTSRAMGADWDEDLVTRTLLLKGFTFMGLRIYEAQLGLKYLRCLDQVDAGRIALVGHCGGSIAGALIARVEPGFRAFVSDFNSNYMTGVAGRELADETVPALYPYTGLINDLSSCSTPALRVVYAYDEAGDATMDQVFDFLDEQLDVPRWTETILRAWPAAALAGAALLGLLGMKLAGSINRRRRGQAGGPR